MLGNNQAPPPTADLSAARVPASATAGLLQECVVKSGQLLMMLQVSGLGVTDPNLIALASRVHTTHQNIVSTLATSIATGHDQVLQPAQDSPSVAQDNSLSATSGAGSESRLTFMETDSHNGPRTRSNSKRMQPDSNGPTDLFPLLPTTTFSRRAVKLGVPNEISNLFSTSKSSYSPRYVPSTGRLAIHANAINRTVLAHHLVPPRALSDVDKSRYMATLARVQSFARATPSLVKLLLDGGLGVPKSHRQLTDVVAAEYRASPSRIVAQACTRPYVIVETADRDAHPEWWDALMRLRDDPEASVPGRVRLALLVGIEIAGFEETTAESRLPPESNRMYALRERVAIVASVDKSLQQLRRRRGKKQGSQRASKPSLTFSDGCSDLSSLEESESSESDADNNMLASPPTAPTGANRAQQQPPPQARSNIATKLAIPISLLDQRPNAMAIPILRYSPSGHLQTRGPPTLRVLSHILAAPRSLPQVVTNRYLSHTTHYAQGLSRQIMSFAVRRGPARPFAFTDFKTRQKPNQVRNAVLSLVVRPVLVVDRLNKTKGEYYHVRHRLVKHALCDGTGDGENESERDVEAGELVMLLGLEVVGFEKPKAADQVPVLAECRFVVRERFALVVGDLGRLGETSEGEQSEDADGAGSGTGGSDESKGSNVEE